jgi:site-specific DNA-methyltransferase (adenine-specific)
MQQSVRLGDALDLLDDLESASIDAVYIDPPFLTQRTHRGRNRHDGTVRTFNDRWSDTEEYGKWMTDLLAKLKRVLKPTGAVLVHCDWHAAHIIRFALDQVFGVENFRNEIIWSYRRWTAARNSLQRLHQTIYYYAASPAHVMNIPMVDYSPTTNLDQIWHARTRNEDGVSQYRAKDGLAVSSGAKKGVPLGDVWEIPYLNPKAKERTGYPTQKPLELLERLLALAVQPGQVVLDPCCGSGTTLVAAHFLGCDAIGFDVLPEAVELAEARLQEPVRTMSRVARDGRSGYRKPQTDDDVALMKLLKAHAVQRSRLITGVITPEGLAQLGLPENWSVAYSTEPAALADPHALEAVANKKQYQVIITFGELRHSGELDFAVEVATPMHHVLSIPAPPTRESDLDVLRADLSARLGLD